MPTQIDSLQIEIQSNSTSASSGIDGLAKSLGNLKTNGNVGTAVKNLKELGSALNALTSAQYGANKVSALAYSLDKLKQVGSVSSLVKSLESLPAALGKLNNVSFSDVSDKSRQLADSVSALSSIKAGGLGSMVTSIGKLGEVTKSLDDETIAAFTAKVKKLSEALTPLSDKMTTVQAGLRGMNSALKTTTVSVKEADSGINKFALNMSNVINVVKSAIQVFSRFIQLFSDVIDQAIAWDGIVYQFGNAFGDQADEYYKKITEITDALSISKQDFMEFSAMSSSMLAGFGVNKADAREMGLGYTELAYDIWAAFNNTYKTLDGADGAFAAVRSAIAGEVEPIRRAGFTIVDSQLAITAANHGLAYSSQKATEAQKSYLRYLTLVDQAAGRGVIGTYAREMQTAEGAMRTLAQQLKSLAQAFGSLFIPILQKVLPYIQAFVSLVTEAVHAIAAFFGITIQGISWNDYSSGVGSAVESNDELADSAGNATKAVEDLKKATLGIDELNVISPPTAGSGSGGSAGSGGGAGWDGVDVDSIWDKSIYDNIQGQVDKLKEKIRGMIPIVAGIATALAGWRLASFLADIDDANKKLSNLHPVLSSLAKAAVAIGISVAVGAIVWDLTGAYLQGGDIKDWLKVLGTTAIGTALAYWIAGPAGAGLVLATSGIVSLSRLVVELKDGTVDFGDPETWVTMITGGLEAVLGGTLLISSLKKSDVWGNIGTAVSSGMSTAWSWGVKNVPFLETLGPSITGALSGLGSFISANFAPLAIVAAIVGLIALAFVDYDFTELGEKVGEFVGNAFSYVVEFLNSAVDWAVDFWDGIFEGLFAAFDWLKDNLTWDNITEFFTNMFDPEYWKEVLLPNLKELAGNIWDGIVEGLNEKFENLIGNIKEFCDGFVQGFKDGFEIESPSKRFKEIGEYIVEGLWNGIKDMFDTLIQNISDWVSDLISKVKGFFGIRNDGPADETKKVGESTSDGLWSGVSGKAKTLIKNFKDWVSDNVKKVKEFFGIKESGKSSSIFSDIGGNLVQGIIDGITGAADSLWSSLKGWADGIISNVMGLFGVHSPSTVFRDKIGKNLVLGLVKGATDPSALVKPIKDMWDGAKKWWDEKRGGLKKYTPSIGSIYEPLRERWDNAKDWWNDRKEGMKSFTPKIGSIKDKLESAWESAKKWWDRNVKLSIPKLNFEVEYSKVTFSGDPAKWAIVKALDLKGWPSLKFAANGGMFDQGSLVWAGERGAEIVANANNGQTGVMNVEQMREAVYEGVYAAVIAAQRAAANDGDQAVNVYLDGKQLYASMEKRRKERGVGLMGTQVYSY